MKSEVSGLYWSLRMKFKIGLISAAILLSGCATQKMAFPTQNKLTITGNTLVYDGMITGDAVLEAIRMVNDSDQKVTTLRITSSGGDIGVGIEFGHFIKNNDMDVIVSQLCFSACANYILPAAKSVVIEKMRLLGGMVARIRVTRCGINRFLRNTKSSFIAILLAYELKKRSSTTK